MKQVIKPEPTYNSELAKAKGGSLDEAVNMVLNNAIGCLGAVIDGMEWLKMGYPEHKCALEDIMQNGAKASVQIMDLQRVMFKDLNTDKDE